jgi:hypothetical protein
VRQVQEQRCDKNKEQASNGKSLMVVASYVWWQSGTGTCERRCHVSKGGLMKKARYKKRKYRYKRQDEEDDNKKEDEEDAV